LFRLLLVKR